MFIPVNFAIGALVGAAATYVYKDASAKETLSSLGNKAKGGLDSTLGMFKKSPETNIEEEISTESVVAEQASSDSAMSKEAEVVAEEKSNKV